MYKKISIKYYKYQFNPDTTMFMTGCGRNRIWPGYRDEGFGWFIRNITWWEVFLQ